MARGRGAEKSAQKGKGKAIGSSSLPVKKTKSVNEVTGVSKLRIPSPILEKERSEDIRMEEITVVIPLANVEEQLHHSMKKATLSEWLGVLDSVTKQGSEHRRLSWADRMDADTEQIGNVEKQESPQVNPNTPTVTIESEDIQEEIEYWSLVVVCYVLRANPPLTIMEGFFRRIWWKLGIEKVAFIGKGVFIVRFTIVETCLQVATEGFLFFLSETSNSETMGS